MASGKEKLAKEIADYVETHKDYANLSKRDVAMATVRVLTDDLGAAQQYVEAIGLDVDLYKEGFYEQSSPSDSTVTT